MNAIGSAEGSAHESDRLPPRLGGAVAALLLCGCALKPVSVTGKESSGQRSETSFAINRVGNAATLTVTYNDGADQSAIQFTPTTRITKKGATHLGWSCSTDYGATWAYGGSVARTLESAPGRTVAPCCPHREAP